MGQAGGLADENLHNPSCWNWGPTEGVLRRRTSSRSSSFHEKKKKGHTQKRAPTHSCCYCVCWSAQALGLKNLHKAMTYWSSSSNLRNPLKCSLCSRQPWGQNFKRSIHRCFVALKWQSAVHMYAAETRPLTLWWEQLTDRGAQKNMAVEMWVKVSEKT